MVSATSARGDSRFGRASGWPADLLLALAAHASRLVDGEDAAVVAWPAGGDAAHADVASTSDDRRWLAILRHVGTTAAATSHGASTHPARDRAVVTVGFRAAGRHGVLAVCRTDDRPLSPGALALLDDVRGLVAAALEAVTARTRPPERAAAAARPAGAAAPSTDFHHRLPKAFERLEGLPALSASRDTLLAVLEDPAPSQLAIVRAIESDIALLIAVLRLANEARRARRPQIWSVPDAIQALTPEGVETMARRMTVFDFFQRVAGWAIPPERFRLHAILTQRAAQQLARVLDHPDPDHLIVAALLHDVGKLVLMEAFANYPEQVVRGGGTPEQRLRAERQALGLDHQMAGGVLLRRWRLPERLAEIVGHHHNPGDDRDATIIQLADALALYAQSQPVSPAELERTAAAVGVTTPQLRTLMFELSRPEGQAPRSSRTLDPSPLSKRETEMLQRLAEGLTYKDIAQATGLSISTVRTHLNNVYKKLDVSDRAQAVLTATARGWI